MSPRRLLIALVLGTPFVAACAAAEPAPEPPPPGPVYALVLGTAQDAGLPQAGCFEACCEAARRDPQRRRLVTSVLIVDGRSGRRWLLDCTPDIEAQVTLARGHPPQRRPAPVQGGRPPLFDGIFLTHAHMGHYTGLLELGREAYGSRGQAVWGTERMLRFLGANDPWAHQVQSGQIRLQRLVPGAEVELAEDLTLTALAVPHRDELTDTVAFRVQGPERTLLYLPDIDKWERWSTPIEEVLAGVDAALLDGAFFADGEIPGRSMADIPHPFIAESLARFGSLPATERAKVWFTHLNHTNPAADPASAAARTVQRAGMGVAREGQRIAL